MKKVLKRVDAKVVTALFGQSRGALTLKMRHNFASVLLDVQMLGMDGFETATLMCGANKTKHIPIIFVTAINHEDKHVLTDTSARRWIIFLSLLIRRY